MNAVKDKTNICIKQRVAVLPEIGRGCRAGEQPKCSSILLCESLMYKRYSAIF